MEPDLVKELRLWSSLKPGDRAPVNNWGPALSKLLNEAAGRLERLERFRTEAARLLYPDKRHQHNWEVRARSLNGDLLECSICRAQEWRGNPPGEVNAGF